MADIRWEAPEFEHRPKSANWYWATIGIAVAMLLLAIWQKTILFGLFIIIAEVLLIVWAAEEPKMIKFDLSEKGLKIGERHFYPMRELASFSADLEGSFDEAYPDIVLNFNHHFRPHLRIKAPMAWLPEIRRALRVHIPEKHFEPGFIEVLEKYLGF
jgi:hypothetical protein